MLLDAYAMRYIAATREAAFFAAAPFMGAIAVVPNRRAARASAPA